MGYGVPPTPLLINTSNTGLENTTSVFIKFTQVSTPYVEFKIFIFCQQQINSSQRQIITLSKSKLNFFGGNITLSLSPTNIYSSYNCSLKLSNIFANSTFRFVLNGSKYGHVTHRTTKSENTTTTPHPNTAFHFSIIVVTILLIIISLVLTVIIVKITYLCLKRRSYSVIKTEKLGELESKIGDQSFETTFIAGEKIPNTNLCETTSI